jgi:hypothetical protein
MRRACDGLRRDLAKILDRLVPYAAPECVVGEALDVLGEPVGVEPLDRRHDPTV